MEPFQTRDSENKILEMTFWVAVDQGGTSGSHLRSMPEYGGGSLGSDSILHSINVAGTASRFCVDAKADAHGDGEASWQSAGNLTG